MALRLRREPVARQDAGRAAAHRAALADPQSQLVTLAPQIHQLLGGLREHRAVVSASTPDSDALFNTALLGLDLEQNGLFLDELTPRHGNRGRRVGEQLLCFSRLSGLSVRFETEIRAITHQNGVALYFCSLPTEVFHGQKRAHFRIRIGLGLKVPLILSNTEDKAFNGELHDLSLGGLGASFPAQTPIASGHRIPACWLELPEAGAIYCALEIRHVTQDEQSGELRAGCAFIDLTPMQERTIQRTISAMERERRRRGSLETG
jgi:c-di-GMP-binding flagellar brake protein YcgR